MLRRRKHGCCAIEPYSLETESSEEYEALEARWFEAYEPTNDPERHLVAELVNADWLLQRNTRTHLEIEQKLYAQCPNPLDWTEQQQKALGRFQRYKTAAANNVHKARKAVEDYRKAHLNERTNEEKSAIRFEQLISYQNKNKPQPNWKDHLKGMRDQVINMGFTPPDMMNPDED